MTDTFIRNSIGTFWDNLLIYVPSFRIKKYFFHSFVDGNGLHARAQAPKQSNEFAVIVKYFSKFPESRHGKNENEAKIKISEFENIISGREFNSDPIAIGPTALDFDFFSIFQLEQDLFASSRLSFAVYRWWPRRKHRIPSSSVRQLHLVQSTASNWNRLISDQLQHGLAAARGYFVVFRSIAVRSPFISSFMAFHIHFPPFSGTQPIQLRKWNEQRYK